MGRGRAEFNGGESLRRGSTEATGIRLRRPALRPRGPRELSVNGIVPIGEPLGGGDDRSGRGRAPARGRARGRRRAARGGPAGDARVLARPRAHRGGVRRRRPRRRPLPHRRPRPAPQQRRPAPQSLGRSDHQIRGAGASRGARRDRGGAARGSGRRRGDRRGLAGHGEWGAGGIVALPGRPRRGRRRAAAPALAARLPDYRVQRKVRCSSRSCRSTPTASSSRRRCFASLKPPPAPTAGRFERHAPSATARRGTSASSLSIAPTGSTR